MIVATLLLLALAFAGFSARLVLGPSLADRVLAIDGMIVCGIATLVVRAVDSGDGSFLPVAVVARFIEGQGG